MQFAKLQPNPLFCLIFAAIRLGLSGILGPAEGEGRNGVFLARRGHAVTAVDQSQVGLAKASALARSHGVALTTVVGAGILATVQRERDSLVLWAFNPGQGRQPVPIPHQAFVDLVKAWVASGAPCPA